MMRLDLDLDPIVALAARVGAASTRSVLRARIERALDEGDDGDLAARVVRALAACGVSGRVHEATVRLVPRWALPAIAIAPDGSLRVVLARHGGRFAVAGPGSADASLSLAMLEAELGTGPVTWVLGEPTAPLEALRSEGDHHASALARVVALAGLERSDLGVALVLSLGIGIASLVVPVTVQALVGAVAFTGMLFPLFALSVVLAAVLGFAAVLRAVQAWVVERIQQRLFARVSLDIAHRLGHAPIEAFDHAHGPELVNRFFEVVILQKGVAQLLVDGALVSLTVLAGATLLAVYHPLLLGFGLTVIASLVVGLYFLGTGAFETAIAESKKKYAVAAWLEEIARSPEAFRGASGADLAERRTEELVRGYLTERQRHFRVLFRQIVASLLVQVVVTTGLLALGGWLAMIGKITLGQLVAAEVVMTSVVGGFAKLGKQLEAFYDLVAAADKVGHLVDLPRRAETGARRLGGTGPLGASVSGMKSVVADRVTVTLEHPVELPAGKHVAVCGPNGVGKSQLLDVLAGLRQPAEGRVDLQGIDMRDLSREALHEAVVLVRGTPVLDASVADNVRFGREIDASAVDAALATVELLDDVRAMPEGVHTRLVAGGEQLSAGQARRLVLARAIAGRPRMLLLDESLDALDQEAKIRLAGRLLAEDAPWTVVVATHDAEVQERCPLVLELPGGRVRPREEAAQ